MWIYIARKLSLRKLALSRNELTNHTSAWTLTLWYIRLQHLGCRRLPVVPLSPVFLLAVTYLVPHGEHWSTSDEKEQVHDAILQSYIVTLFQTRMSHDIDNLFLFRQAVIWTIACVITQLTWLGWYYNPPAMEKNRYCTWFYLTTLLIDSHWQAFVEGWLQLSIRHRPLWSN